MLGQIVRLLPFWGRFSPYTWKSFDTWFKIVLSLLSQLNNIFKNLIFSVFMSFYHLPGCLRRNAWWGFGSEYDQVTPVWDGVGLGQGSVYHIHLWWRPVYFSHVYVSSWGWQILLWVFYVDWLLSGTCHPLFNESVVTKCFMPKKCKHKWNLNISLSTCDHLWNIWPHWSQNLYNYMELISEVYHWLKTSSQPILEFLKKYGNLYFSVSQNNCGNPSGSEGWVIQPKSVRAAASWKLFSVGTVLSVEQFHL